MVAAMGRVVLEEAAMGRGRKAVLCVKKSGMEWRVRCPRAGSVLGSSHS